MHVHVYIDDLRIGYHCTDAARRFFQTKVEEDSLKTKGKYSDKVKRQRKRNRMNRVSLCVDGYSSTGV